MKMMAAALTAILLCLFLSTGAALAQSRLVNQIRIVSSWMGLGRHRQDELVVRRQSGSYLANGKKISDELIANLLSAIDAPVVAKPDLANLGITQEWLDANAEKAIMQYARGYFPLATPDQKALYFSSFKDPKFIEKILPRLFNSYHTDDYPVAEIDITESDGRVIKVTSKAQPLFMIPWVISRDESSELTTYNANIARALASLMPDKFTNRERLAGEFFGYELAQAVMYEIKDDWDQRAKGKRRPS